MQKKYTVGINVRTAESQFYAEQLLAKYEKGGGASCCSPVMLLKILVYSHMNLDEKRRNDERAAQAGVQCASQNRYLLCCRLWYFSKFYRYKTLISQLETIKRKNHSGYLQTMKVYQYDNCEACPCRSECTNSVYGKMIQRNKNCLLMLGQNLKELKRQEK